jgi:hypothetical protein
MKSGGPVEFYDIVMLVIDVIPGTTPCPKLSRCIDAHARL